MLSVTPKTTNLIFLSSSSDNSRRQLLGAIYFSATPESASVQPGDVVDVAFHPQVNEHRGERSVQMNVLDIRPHCTAECIPETGSYRALLENRLTPAIAGELLPDRATLALVGRYLAANASPAVTESPICLCRKIVRWSGKPMSLAQLMTCLDIFRDVDLLQIRRMRKYLSIRPTPGENKADLSESRTMQLLLRAKES